MLCHRGKIAQVIVTECRYAECHCAAYKTALLAATSVTNEIFNNMLTNQKYIERHFWLVEWNTMLLKISLVTEGANEKSVLYVAQ